MWGPVFVMAVWAETICISPLETGRTRSSVHCDSRYGSSLGSVVTPETRQARLRKQ